jgi:hypothetical protein
MRDSVLANLTSGVSLQVTVVRGKPYSESNRRPDMPSSTQSAKLKNIIRLAQELLDSMEAGKSGKGKSSKAASGQRIRRSGKELIAFRKMLKSERKKGVRVEELASKHGVSTAYIYQLGV